MISMQRINHLSMVLLIIGAILIPAVSAEMLTDEGSNYATFDVRSTSGGGRVEIPGFKIYRIQDWDGLYFVYLKTDAANIGATSVLAENPSYSSDVTLKIGGNEVGTGTACYNTLYNSAGDITGVQIWLDIDTWNPTGYTGEKIVRIFPSSGTLFNGLRLREAYISGSLSPTRPIGFYNDDSRDLYLLSGIHLARSNYYWENEIQISDEFVSLTRKLNGNAYISTLQITSDIGYFKDTSSNDIDVPYVGSGTWNVTNPYGRIYTGTLVSGTPQPTPVQPGLRTGTVTMTDHNGTTITGFEVTAVNHYTGESFTVATDTDVAVITLPMERTIQIRNPQTGVYEEAPIGYYLFYGQAPGYKMLKDDGIEVAVSELYLPEEYSSYKLCDIIVTADSGYLTGKHQFQIRSRSDNSILQTGTINAKSATTGEWYNATVSGGLASLILPYDTSNPISQYAGNYYVYATSPGYEDSDYVTKIVMPHTVSEIHSILLTPIGGVPTPGNVTLRIHAMSETGSGVVNAEIFIAGVLGAGRDVWDTYTASSTGYLSVSVPGNSTYDIVASGAGYDSARRRIQVFDDDPDMIEMRLYLSGYPTLEPPTEPTGWPTGPPPTQPPGGIPDDDSEGFLVQAVRGIGLAFGVGFSTAKIIFGMLLALAIGFATAKQLRGGAAEFGVGLLGGTTLGVLIGLLPVWIIVVLLLVVGLYIGNRYVGGTNNG